MNITKEFFNGILDFGEDWTITKVETDHQAYKIYLYLEYTSDIFEEPQSLLPADFYDYSELREWRHLDILQYQCYVRCKIPRVKCRDGKVRQIALGWADKFSRHTLHFEMRVITLLHITKNQTKTAEYLNCSFHLVNTVLHRSVIRGMDRRNMEIASFEHISIDEKSFKKGHDYITVISHPRSGCVLDVCHGRDQKTVEELMDRLLTEAQRANVNTVSMDMWKPYLNAVGNKMPGAEIVHDHYHLSTYLNKGMDQVRRREVKDHDILKHSRYALLKNEENLTEKQREKYEQIKASNLEVAKVWNIRENFKSLFNVYNEYEMTKGIFNAWAEDAESYGIKEINKVVSMFKNHIKGVVNAMICNLNNAMAERLNGKIQELKSIAKGYRTFENFRNAILFFYGGLDVRPVI